MLHQCCGMVLSTTVTMDDNELAGSAWRLSDGKKGTCKAARSSVLVVSDQIRPAWLWSRNRAVQKAPQLLFSSTAACTACQLPLL